MAPTSDAQRAGAAIVAGLLVWTVSGAAQTVFRAETDLVALQVTVVDEKRRYVPDLRPEDFSVFEDGVPQTISVFATSTSPVDLVLLLDSSDSMYTQLPAVKQAARQFVRALERQDRAAVVLFNQRVDVAQSLSGDRRKLERAILRAPGWGGTALYDALYVTLKKFTRPLSIEHQSRRQALIVFTDAEDMVSRASFDDVLRVARLSDITIYTILLSGWSAPINQSDPRTLAQLAMRQLAEDSGGRSFAPGTAEDLLETCRAVWEEFRHRYWLAFVPTTTTPGFKRLSVRITNHSGLTVLARNGYELK